MLLKTKDPNALNFFEIRKAKYPLPYFEYIQIPLKYNLEIPMTNWIQDNLKGRFYIGIALTVQTKETKSIAKVLKIGFEDPKELSYFTLACPYLKYN
jgi:hypothetical protein